ncbi:DUF3265 domain-containing protein [Vibrio vulnificus]|nr:DUF3265 domain-containing protein [Vibrio vulnificus]PWY27384.1 DUF3265 domain-containing protein [Vibrio vulnificus]HAS6339543.1 DUF3265 domain-containing protein [Vibrio vulnificus]HDY7501775.1 DUF3265 domain-containing protein [Vibrio vulnificus]HDY7602139.1 DUF3265 domain-containing protein [Vibrio vulnificus]HDY7712446.1 DUF3265 domain-containing protein [Vibrio vulnificus]
MTRRSRGIYAAWHFWYAVSFGGESGLRKAGLGGIHPLTQRYVSEYPTFSRHFTKLDLGSN